MKSPHKNRRFFRRGATVVEAAVMAPLMMAGTLGVVEVGSAYMAKQTVTLAAREGARVGVLPGAAQSDIQARVDSVMTGNNLTGYTTDIQTGSTSDPDVKVTVSLPFSRATFTGGFFGGGTMNLKSTATMRKEGASLSSGGTGITGG